MPQLLSAIFFRSGILSWRLRRKCSLWAGTGPHGWLARETLVEAVLPQLVAAAALVSGVVLLGAGVPKVIASDQFAGQLADYGIVPKTTTRVVAVLISTAEVLAGLLLLVGLLTSSSSARVAGAILACGLFAVFLVALVSAQRQGRKIACACFGGNSELETIGPHSIVRTGALLALAVIATLHTHSVAPFAAIGLGVALAALVALLSEMARLFGPLRRVSEGMFDELQAAAAIAAEPKGSP
jgi:uncharacterized membrane protein YphA (DoxX/SURF4 family)